MADSKKSFNRQGKYSSDCLIRVLANNAKPKGIDISGYSQLQLNALARQLNERRRKTLGFHTPAEMLSERVASTS